METLTLPEPAATLWKKIGPRLQDAMREILGGNERWTMTGGTILTARYRHRSSDDIDLHLAPSAADRLVAKRCPHFMASMKELGATGGYQGVRQIVISFPPSELDVWQRPHLPSKSLSADQRDQRRSGGSPEIRDSTRGTGTGPETREEGLKTRERPDLENRKGRDRKWYQRTLPT